MKEGMTVQELFDKIDYYRRTKNGSVVIHPGLPANLIELKEDFVQQLKRELQTNIMMAQTGIDELSACTKFVIMMLEDSY